MQIVIPNADLLIKDTREFAHHYCGKLWRFIGWIMLIVSIIIMIYPIGKDTGYVGAFGGALAVVQAIVLIVSVIPTESALKKHFDKWQP